MVNITDFINMQKELAEVMGTEYVIKEFTTFCIGLMPYVILLIIVVIKLILHICDGFERFVFRGQGNRDDE